MLTDIPTPHRWRTIWAGLAALIVILAGGLRLATYDFALPYVDHPDEPTIYLKAQEWRGLHDMDGHARAYPPGTVAVNYVVQRALEATDRAGLSPTTRVMRAISALLNGLTLLAVMASARRLGGPFAAVTAGAIWVSTPVLLETGVYALADPWVFLLVALAVWLALEATLDETRRAWIIGSGAAGMIAAVFKYPAGSVLVVTGAALLVQLWRTPRQGIRHSAILVGLGSATAVYLLAIYRAGRFLERETDLAAETRTNGFVNLLNWDRVSNNLYYALWTLDVERVLIIGGIGLLAGIIAWRRGLPRASGIGVGLVLVAALGIGWQSAMFSDVAPDHRLRDVIPITHLLTILFGVGAAQVAALLRTERSRHAAQVALLLGVLIIWGGDIRATWELAQDRQLADRRAVVRAWADAVLEPGTVLLGPENEKTFNPFWGNSAAEKWFPWWIAPDVLEHSVAAWRADYGISYALLNRGTRDALAATETGRAFLDDLLLLNEFSAPPEQRGPEMAFYRLWGMDVKQRARFGPAIHLRGYDVSAEQLAPGETLTLRFYWRASAPPASNLALFVHLTPLDAVTILAQADGAPGVPSRPTLLWTDPDETIISQPVHLPIPADLPPGTYQVRIGLYDYATFARLPVYPDPAPGAPADGDSLPLLRVTVTPPDG